MSIYRSQYENIGDNTYNSIRSGGGNNPGRSSARNPGQRPMSYNQQNCYGEDNRQESLPPKRNGIVKLNEVRKRVHEVIDLCKGENVDVKGEFSQVISQQRQIYNMLMQNPSILQRTLSQQSFPHNIAGHNMQNVSYRQSQKGQQIVTPYRPQKPQFVPQSQQYILNFSQVGARENNFAPNISYSNVLRPQQTGYLQGSHQVNMPFANLGAAGYDTNPTQNLQSSLHKIKSSKQIHLNEDALRLIEEIQRKAFEQIQKLRRQKLQLMQKLNQQIKNLNEQKRINAQLSSRLASSSQPHEGPSLGLGAGQNAQAQIFGLRSQLQKANDLNNNLRMELSQRGSGVPGINELLRQGQVIRLETLKLLKLKEQGQSNQVIQELQRRLASQKAQNQRTLNEVKALKQRLGQGSYRRSYQPDIKSTTKARSPTNIKGAGRYEDLVSEMKRITGF